jgi:Flp pilus assembly protein TadG
LKVFACGEAEMTRLAGLSLRLRNKITGFAADQGGVILPLVATSILALLGMGAVALDLARYFDLQSQLQKAADAFALAGAAEFDGRPAIGGQGDAISRANADIATLMASRNQSTWGPAVTTSINYFSSLSGDDSAGVGSGVTTADPTAAHYVEVVVSPAEWPRGHDRRSFEEHSIPILYPESSLEPRCNQHAFHDDFDHQRRFV